jgi:hypothetical protein
MVSTGGLALSRVSKRFAPVASCGNVLVERAVLDGVDIGKLRDRQTGAAKHSRNHKRE